MREIRTLVPLPQILEMVQIVSRWMEVVAAVAVAAAAAVVFPCINKGLPPQNINATLHNSSVWLHRIIYGHPKNIANLGFWCGKFSPLTLVRQDSLNALIQMQRALTSCTLTGSRTHAMRPCARGNACTPARSCSRSCTSTCTHERTPRCTHVRNYLY